MADCMNNYSSENEYFESFGSDDAMRNCNRCPNFTYEDGTIICDKFNRKDITVDED